MLKLLLFASILINNIAFANKMQIINNLTPVFGPIAQEDVVKTPFNGVYEVISHNPINSLFVSADGNYIIQGDIVNLKTRQALQTSSRVNTLKKSLISNIPEQDKIIFKAKNEKYVLHVFTDVDCPFCKKLHNQMNEMNALGITIKYLAAPLASIHPEARVKMEKIWCAKDKIKAMNEYKTMNIIPESKTCDNPVLRQLLLSQQLGVKGTPAIFLSNGTHIPGYIPTKRLLKKIEKNL